MIPSIVSQRVRKTILDYLRTTFDLADERFEQALFDFLDGPGGPSCSRSPSIGHNLFLSALAKTQLDCPTRTRAPGIAHVSTRLSFRTVRGWQV